MNYAHFAEKLKFDASDFGPSLTKQVITEYLESK